jgi:hypothetical protein
MNPGPGGGFMKLFISMDCLIVSSVVRFVTVVVWLVTGRNCAILPLSPNNEWTLHSFGHRRSSESEEWVSRPSACGAGEILATGISERIIRT